MEYKDIWPPSGLTEKEWQELVTIDYVLTWRYSDEEERDEKRQKELRDKRWAAEREVD